MGTLTLTVRGFSSAIQAKLADGTPVPTSVCESGHPGSLNVSVTANDEIYTISTAYDVVLRDSTGVELWRSVWGGISGIRMPSENERFFSLAFLIVPLGLLLRYEFRNIGLGQPLRFASTHILGR